MTPPDGGILHRPTDKELAYILLWKTFLGYDDPRVPVLNLYDYEPWELPQHGVKTDDREWCIICPRQGERGNRLTEEGYWKVTGNEHKIKDGQEEIGTKRILIFYRGRTPNGKLTGWKMHQYSAALNMFSPNQQGIFVLCKIIDKSNGSEGNMPNYYEDELSSSMTVSGAYQIPTYSSFEYGGISQSMNSENKARDAATLQQVDAELEPYLETSNGWGEQNPSFHSASEWEMQAEQRLYNVFIGDFQFLSEPETDQW
ncbi:NAC domain-containing protein 62 [Ricinus communis]|uniref:Transcription factor, putative n=1 Tax=Ricinus communis TaxID=3988 RepID=B9S231_RICCO|nr:NAC domain-containing protein 62 [Ricinus communis]EEF42374.1 transcription factor, putative [Ricinus communis]|eukprot:XP_002520050.1 NAC domain-containing protein 62 [Ricinus communis]